MQSSAPVTWVRRGAEGAAPQVFFHGFTGAAAAWDPVIAGLPAEEGVVTVALPGHHPASPAVAEGFVASCAAVLAQLQAARVPPASWVGYSLGARLALGMAIAAPAACTRLILIGVNPGLEDEPARRARRAADDAWQTLLRDRGLASFVAAWEAQPLFASAARLPEAARAAQRHQREEHDPEQLAQSLATCGLGAMPSAWEALGRLPMPVQLVVGEEDAKFRALAVRMLPRLRQGTLHLVPACGHNVPLEAPPQLAALVHSARPC
jgi:2-succinyl-6-hydroxy-2,4-cyclohexadiene-1-carboxylate synthase